MALDIMVDLNVLLYHVLIFMKEQGAIVGRGRAFPQPLGEAEPTLGCRAGRNQPSDIGRGRAGPQSSGEVEPALSHRMRQSLALGGRARRSQPIAVKQGGA